MKTTAYFLALVLSVALFLFSCVVTLSDGQGALIFIFTIPVMAILLGGSWWLGTRMSRSAAGRGFQAEKIPAVFAAVLVLFFISAFIPGLNLVPAAFLGLVGKTFEFTVGKTPMVFFRERNSFSAHLARALRDDSQKKTVNFSHFDVSFAWDRVCIFAPYTDNAKARSILSLDWNIEDRSQIHHSDSIHALVFLFEGKVNHLEELQRGIADFKGADLCLDRGQTEFSVAREGDGRKVLLR